MTVVGAVAATVGLSWIACGGRLSSRAQSAAAQQTVVKVNTDFPPTITEGVCGMVLFYEGDFVQGLVDANAANIDSKTPRYSVWPELRRVVALELTSTSQAEPSAARKERGFYGRVQTGFVAETISDENGFFEMSLPPGRYSLFVIEGDGLYSSSVDGQGYIHPITVESGKVHRTSVNITYKVAM